MVNFREFVLKSYFYLKGKIPGKVAVAIFIVIISWLFFLYYPGQKPKLTKNNGQTVLAEISGVSARAPLELITEPEDGIGGIRNDIDRASNSIDLVMYELEDKNIEQALIDAKNRGLKVRVLLQNVNTFGKHPNQEAYDFLKNNNVSVKWAPDYFPLTHQKTFVIDGQFAVIMTFNLNAKYYDSGRDFAVVDNDPKDITAIKTAFASDWNSSEYIADVGSDLVWSPGSAETMLTLVNSALTSLDVYNEEMADTRIIDALIKAAGRGVLVRVDMTYATNWKSAFGELAAGGVNVRTYASGANLYIHAKSIIVDQKEAFLGSENFSFQSLEANRELGILISKPDIVSSLEGTFNKDWLGSRPFTTATKTTSLYAGVIKLSKSGICHAPDSPFYNQTKNFTAYTTIKDCLAAGGRLPAN